MVSKSGSYEEYNVLVVTFYIHINRLALAYTAAMYHFETLYAISTIFLLILMNLGQRREGEWSAYSVFNDGFVRLLGTTTGEMIDAEIRHRN